MAYDKPLPRPTSDTKPFWDGCRRHELHFQKCLQCDHIRWPPSILCPFCHSQDTAWIRAEGKGKIYTYAIYHRAFHKGFEQDLPYITAVIELKEGPHFLSNIIDCDPEAVHINMAVELAWEDRVEQFSIPKFRPVKTS